MISISDKIIYLRKNVFFFRTHLTCFCLFSSFLSSFVSVNNWLKMNVEEDFAVTSFCISKVLSCRSSDNELTDKELSWSDSSLYHSYY